MEQQRHMKHHPPHLLALEQEEAALPALHGASTFKLVDELLSEVALLIGDTAVVDGGHGVDERLTQLLVHRDVEDDVITVVVVTVMVTVVTVVMWRRDCSEV